MRWCGIFVVTVISCGVSAQFSATASGQAPARWLGQKTKEFSQGQSPADVLQELAKKHKFAVKFDDEAVESALDTGSLYGSVDGLSIKQLVTAISQLAATDGPLPWMAEKSSLKFLDPAEVVTVVHDVSLLGPLMTSDFDFFQAVMNSVPGDWDPDEANVDVENDSVLEVTPATMAVRQSNRCQTEIYELFELLKQEVDQGAATKFQAGEKKLLRVLSKPTAVKSTELSVLETFRKLLTENHVPWVLLVPSDSDVDLEAILQVAEGKHRIIDLMDIVAMRLNLTIDLIDGVLVMAVTEPEDLELSLVRLRVYSIQRLLGNSHPLEVADEIMALDNVSVEGSEVLGPLLIIRSDFKSHRRIQAAINGESEQRELDEQIVQLKNLLEEPAGHDNNDPPDAPGDAIQSGVPRLLSPKAGAVLANGDFTKSKEREWVFDWADVPNASSYHLFVKGASARIPVIDRNDISKSAWKDIDTGVVMDPFLRNWTWKVRAFVNGEWTDWSDERIFHVRPAPRP